MDERLLEKFFKGQCTEEEKQQVFLWHMTGQLEKFISDKVETVWKEEQKRGEPWRKAETFRKIHERIADAGQERGKSRKLWNWSYAAAAVLMLVVAVGLIWSRDGGEVKEMQLQAESRFVSEETRKGEHKTLTLADGTTIELNVDSRVWYSENYGKGPQREIFLEGEAFFDVARDTLHPFLVHTGTVEVTVLGTSFNINAYQPEESVTVSVVTGKVAVAETKRVVSSAHLVANEQVVYSRIDSALHRSSFDSRKVLSWRERTLYFSNASFAEIKEKLERWYDVEIEVRRKVVEGGFTGIYTNRSLESVLTGIGFVMHFDHEIDGRTVVIK